MSKGGQKAPDPYAVAQAQTQSNIATAQNQAALNAVDTYNPYGSSTFTRDQNGDPTAQINQLNPVMQYLLGGQQGLMAAGQGVGGDIINNLNPGQIAPYEKTGFDASNYNDPAANQAFQGEMALLNPQFEQAQKQFDESMASRGLPVGSEAYNSANQTFQGSKNAALTNAAANAQQTGFTQGLQGAQFNAGQNNQLFANQVTGEQVPYSNLATLLATLNPQTMLGMAPSSGVPQSSIQPTNVSGDVYQSAAMKNQIAQQNASNIGSLVGGLGSLFLL